MSNNSFIQSFTQGIYASPKTDNGTGTTIKQSLLSESQNFFILCPIPVMDSNRSFHLRVYESARAPLPPSFFKTKSMHDANATS